MEELRDNEQRGKLAIAFIWIVLILEAVSLVSGWFQYELLQRIASGTNFTMAEAVANDTRERIIGLLFAVAYIISVIMFIRWFRRAYFNLHTKVTWLLYGEGWAAGAWFVPILSLFRPVQIMNELYHYTKELLVENNLMEPRELKSGIVVWWWILWIVNNVVAAIVFRLSLSTTGFSFSNTPSDAIAATVFGMVSHAIGIILAIVTIRVVIRYSNAEWLLAQIPETEEEEAK